MKQLNIPIKNTQMPIFITLSYLTINKSYKKNFKKLSFKLNMKLVDLNGLDYDISYM